MKRFMTRLIEEKALDIWENAGLTVMIEYLKREGYSEEEIESMREKWQEGKSLYPFAK